MIVVPQKYPIGSCPQHNFVTTRSQSVKMGRQHMPQPHKVWSTCMSLWTTDAPKLLRAITNFLHSETAPVNCGKYSRQAPEYSMRQLCLATKPPDFCFRSVNRKTLCTPSRQPALFSSIIPNSNSITLSKSHDHDMTYHWCGRPMSLMHSIHTESILGFFSNSRPFGYVAILLQSQPSHMS